MCERRKSDRYCFNLDLQPEGDLVLLVDERSFEVWKLIDISPFGACLSIDADIDSGSHISLQYRCVENEFEVFGTVAWNSPENSNEEGVGFRVGLDFNRDEMALNAHLFKALTA